MAVGDKRETFTCTTTAVNKDFNADGGAVLVELTGASSWDGTVDFQTTPDGATFYNVPYINRAVVAPTQSVAQISSPSTATLYLILGPLSQVRIACGAGTTGTLTVVYRTIPSLNNWGVSEVEGDEAEGSGSLPNPVLIGGDDGTDIKNINVDATTGDVQVDLTAGSAVIGKVKNDPTFSAATGSSAIALAVNPSGAFRLLRVECHFSAAPTTSENFTVTLDAGDGAAYDVLLRSEDPSATSATDLVFTFGEGWEFETDDDIDVAFTNTDGATYGLRVVYELI